MLSNHFAQTLINLEMVQLAESVKQVKAMRHSTNSKTDIPVYFELLKHRLLQRTKRKGEYRKLESTSQLQRDEAVFAGREFLVSFDANQRLPDMWVSGFELACINFLREDLEFRQR